MRIIQNYWQVVTGYSPSGILKNHIMSTRRANPSQNFLLRESSFSFVLMKVV